VDQAKSAALLTWAKARLRGPSIHLTAGKVRYFDALIEAVRVALKSAAQTAGDMISRGAGLSLGFNAIDGD